MKTLTEARCTGAVRQAVTALLLRHVVVTGVGTAAIVIGADLIAHAYGVSNTPLATLLRLNAFAALVMSCNNVFERLLFCAGAQMTWVRAAIAGNVAQLIVVVLFMHQGLAIVGFAVLCGSLLTLVLCLVLTRPLLARR